MLCMTRKEFDELRNDHRVLLLNDYDASEALRFVAEWLWLEAKATEKAEPYAVRSIQKLEEAANIVSNLCLEFENEDFSPSDDG